MKVYQLEPVIRSSAPLAQSDALERVTLIIISICICFRYCTIRFLEDYIPKQIPKKNKPAPEICFKSEMGLFYFYLLVLIFK